MTEESSPPARRSDLRELARGGSITFAGAMGGAVCTFLLLVVLARTLGSVSAGLFFQAVAVVSTCAVASAWGAVTTLTPRVARHLALGERDLSGIAAAALVPVGVASVVVALAIVAFHNPLASAMTSTTPDRHVLGQVLVATAPAAPLIALTRLLTALARGTGAMGPTALYDAGGQPLLRLVLCGVPAAAGTPLWAVGATFSLASLLCFLAAIPHVLGNVHAVHARWGRATTWPGDEARRFWAYSAPRGLEELFQVTNTWVLVVLVGALATPGDAATYAAISRFTLASTMLMVAVITGMATRLTVAMTHHDHERAATLFGTAVNWTVGLSLPVAAAMFVFPSALLALVSPHLPGGELGLRVLAVATVVTTVTGPSGAVILFAGRSAWNLWIAIPSVVLMLGLAVALVPSEGANGASYAWAAGIGLQSAIGYVVTRRAFGLDPFRPSMFRLAGWSALLTVPAEVLAWALVGDTTVGLVLGVGLGGALFLAVNQLTRWRLWGRATR